ncbi:MAG: glycerophosphodiester phosphodiesterase [Actinobacteria bacterium]|nr:glycerophosphodiester phosphodiesterase [Actinomycetota bacterium]
MPRSPWSFLDHPGPLAFAHQGGAGEHPENTMAAFEHAVSLGYRYLETDVHATADGVLVAFHDDELDRVTDRVGRIGDLPWSEVRQARVAGSHAIPLLEDLLGTWPQACVNIDPKHDASVEPLVEVLRRTDSVHRVCVGAFSDRRLARVRRQLGPDLCTSLGPLGIGRLMAAARRVPTGRLPAACAQVPVATRGVTVLDRRLVEAVHRRGMQVHVWTIDDREEMVRLLDLGVDGIMTDRPAVLKQVLQERGDWHQSEGTTR